MNLKESFRFQNKLQILMDEAHTILNDDRNVTRRETTILRKKVMAEAENETTVAIAPSEYADRISADVLHHKKYFAQSSFVPCLFPPGDFLVLIGITW